MSFVTGCLIIDPCCLVPGLPGLLVLLAGLRHGTDFLCEWGKGQRLESKIDFKMLWASFLMINYFSFCVLGVFSIFIFVSLMCGWPPVGGRNGDAPWKCQVRWSTVYAALFGLFTLTSFSPKILKTTPKHCFSLQLALIGYLMLLRNTWNLHTNRWTWLVKRLRKQP